MSASKVIALTKQRKQSEHGIRMSRQAIQVAALLGAHSQCRHIVIFADTYDTGRCRSPTGIVADRTAARRNMDQARRRRYASLLWGNSLDSIDAERGELLGSLGVLFTNFLPPLLDGIQTIELDENDTIRWRITDDGCRFIEAASKIFATVLCDTLLHWRQPFLISGFVFDADLCDVDVRGYCLRASAIRSYFR
jgi:hypothetical protein